ncbi:MAG: YihY/virulence factor BrkB family protein [Rhizomicrobium sp.]
MGARQFLKALYRRISQDRVLAISAGVTFYALLAIFPAIAVLVSIYGIFADAKTFHDDIASMGAILPGGAIEIVTAQIRRVASNSHHTLGLAALGGILISLWSANSGVKAMFDALNIVLREQEKRSFIRLNATSLAFAAGGLVVAFVAVAVVLAVPEFLKSLGWSLPQNLVDIARWPVIWVCIALAIALVYRFGPSRNDIPWRWISWGSALASFVWLGASMGFSWYAANFGTYNKTYGSLGAVIGFMTWIWISAIIVLVGEELDELLERMQRPHDRPDKPHPLETPREARG